MALSRPHVRQGVAVGHGEVVFFIAARRSFVGEYLIFLSKPHELHLPPPKMEFLWLQINALAAAGLTSQNACSTPSYKSAIDATIFPWHPLYGVVEYSCVRVWGGTVSHEGAQVSVRATGGDDGGVAAALFIQPPLVEVRH